jgi:hypothetical protein
MIRRGQVVLFHPVERAASCLECGSKPAVWEPRENLYGRCSVAAPRPEPVPSGLHRNPDQHRQSTAKFNPLKFGGIHTAGNILLKLPPYAPELNPAENIWEYIRGNTLSHQVWETYEALVEACCNARNGLMRTPEIIRSIATRQWTQVET